MSYKEEDLRKILANKNPKKPSHTDYLKYHLRQAMRIISTSSLSKAHPESVSMLKKTINVVSKEMGMDRSNSDLAKYWEELEILKDFPPIIKVKYPKQYPKHEITELIRANLISKINIRVIPVIISERRKNMDVEVISLTQGTTVNEYKKLIERTIETMNKKWIL